jgi:hypothetical protein
MELYLDGRRTTPFLGICFSVLPVIRSYAGAFVGLSSSCVMFRIFLGVKMLFVLFVAVLPALC